MRLVEQKEPCGHGEPYVPTGVDRILGSSDVALRGPWDTTNIVKIAPTAADLSRPLFDYHLDFPGSALTPGCTYDRWSHRLNAGVAPRTYARVVTEAGHPDALALQYWFFYVFNDFNDKHEGDWEMIQLDFAAPSAADALRAHPSLVGYSQHEGAESAHWGDAKLTRLEGTHPVVYAALGSHANYFTAALHLGRSAAQGVGCDDTSMPSRQIRPAVSLIPTRRAAYLRSYPWLAFEGRWGEAHQGFYNGPTGPATKLQWTAPITWANEEWRDKSFTVPVGAFGRSTATDFFCGAVGTASGLLTVMVGNPSPVFVGLVLILAVLLWLISRTQWQPSAPLRLGRRRAWGSIVNASRRMYVRHLRTFLGIGLIAFPVGALVALIQYELFRVTGFDGLVASVGTTNVSVGFLVVLLDAVLMVLALACVQAATAIAMVDIDEGREPHALAAYRQALPRLPPILATVLLAAVGVALVSLTAVGTLLAVWLIVRWSFLAQAVALEGLSTRHALRRSARLVRGNWWRVASLLLFVALVAVLVGPLLGMLLLFVSHASFDFINLLASVVDAVLLPFTAIATTYMYFDLRLQHGAETTEVAADEVLPAEEPPPAALAQP